MRFSCDTDDLRQSSKILISARDCLDSALAQLGNSPSSVPSDGAYAPLADRVRADAAQAQNGGGQLQSRVQELADELFRRAVAFEEANEAGASAMLRSVGYMGALPVSPTIGLFTRLAQLRLGWLEGLFGLVGGASSGFLAGLVTVFPGLERLLSGDQAGDPLKQHTQITLPVRLNLRPNPGTSSGNPPILVIPAGSTVTVTGDRCVMADGHMWVKVRTPEGKEGWIASDLLVAGAVPAVSTSHSSDWKEPNWTDETREANKPVGEYRVSGGDYPTYAATYNKDGTVKDPPTLHPGVDIKPSSGRANPPVYPIGPGVVTLVRTCDQVVNAKGELGYVDGVKVVYLPKDQPTTLSPKLKHYGHYVMVKHVLSDGSEVYSLYGHLASPSSLKVGQIVDSGTELGIMGSTGNSTGPHLHLEVRLGEESLKQNGYTGTNPNAPSTIAKDPHDPNGPKLTMLEAMKLYFKDPKEVIDGHAGWKFLVPPPNPQQQRM